MQNPGYPTQGGPLQLVTKPCRVCEVAKDISFFVKNKAFKSGIDTICLDCSREKVKIHRKTNKTRRSPHRKGISAGWRDIIVDFLLKRDGLICGICKESLEGSAFHIDHILPVALGGKDIMSNVQLAHPKCNMAQSNIIRKQARGF